MNKKIVFIQYPPCSTCKKAKTWLENNSIDFESRHIVEEKLTESELKNIIFKSNLPLKRFFNTSGVLYREMNLKDKLPTMSEDEMIKILATNGKLVKRPIIVSEKGVLVGFKVDEWESFFDK